MVFMPPQHGKSELTTRRTPAKILGDRPETRIAIAGYSSTFVKGFNDDIQVIIDSAEYNRMYPNTYLNRTRVANKESGRELRNRDEFRLVGQRGGLRVTGVDGGTLTGRPVDVFIMDDPYESRDAAMSRAINERVWSFYINVAKMRLHNNSQELLVMTRWHEDDIAARLLKKQKGQWEVIVFPAILETPTPGDPRKVGEPLWPSHLSIDNLFELKDLSSVTFQASYQQDPKAPKDVLVYPTWYTADKFPDEALTFIGGDFGYTNDPTATVQMQVIKGKRNKVYVRELLYARKMSNAKIVEAHKLLGVNIKKRHIWDSEDPKSIQDLVLKGMYAMPAVKGPGSLNMGINELRECDIYVVGGVGKNPNLVAELNAYQFHMFGGNITNEPVDKDNHLMDAMRYAYTNRHLNGGLGH